MKIMICYDGTQESKQALNLARTHALAFKADIHVVNSLAGDDEKKIAGIEKAEKDLAYARVFLKEEEITCETTLLTKGMSVGENIVKFAKDNAVDEIIIGVVMKSKVGKLIFGSTAQYVILKAPCPVVTVKATDE